MTADTPNTNGIKLPARTTELISRAQHAHDRSHWKGFGDLDVTTRSFIEIIAREVTRQFRRDHSPEYDIADAAARAVTAIKIAITEGYTREDIDSPDLKTATNQIKRVRILREQAMERQCPQCGADPCAPCEEDDRPIESIHAQRLFPDQFGINFIFETIPSPENLVCAGTAAETPGSQEDPESWCELIHRILSTGEVFEPSTLRHS
jgi:hypothetical protein